ncbi:MAG: asparaginase [Actinomycetaceae bacterium]|nr:asparaginase [Actinomycetaceae bacterium]
MRIGIASMGGTIAMAPTEHGGIEPSFDAVSLAAAVPALADIGQLVTTDVCNVGSPSVTIDSVLQCLAWAKEQVRDGAGGIVVTHGTDTLEESAYLLDLFWDEDVPLVVTGAMRSPQEPGADGPANLLAAATVAASDEARGLGVLVVMNDEVFLARRVRKVNTFRTDAFASPEGTAIGRFVEGRFELGWLSAQGRPAPLPVPTGRARIGIVQTCLGEEGATITAAGSVNDGLVIDGVGAGHVAGPAVAAVEEVMARVPVVMASRTGSGRTGETTYAYPGGDVDLVRRGVIMAGRLTAAQARLLLWALVAGGASRGEIAEAFAARKFG